MRYVQSPVACICTNLRPRPFENKQIPHYQKPSPSGRRCRRMPADEGAETINEFATALQKGLHFIKKFRTEVNQMSGRFDPAFLFIGRWWRCVSYFGRLLNTILHNYPWGKSCICSRCLTELRTDKSVRVTLTLPRLPAIRRTLCRGVCSFVFRAAKTTVTIFFARQSGMARRRWFAKDR